MGVCIDAFPCDESCGPARDALLKRTTHVCCVGGVTTNIVHILHVAPQMQATDRLFSDHVSELICRSHLYTSEVQPHHELENDGERSNHCFSNFCKELEGEE